MFKLLISMCPKKDKKKSHRGGKKHKKKALDGSAAELEPESEHESEPES